MKICIPTKQSNPNLFSEVTSCPLDAKSFILYNTRNQETMPLTIPHIKSHSSIEIIGSFLQVHNINSIVSIGYCKEFRDTVKTESVELWLCTALTVSDTINIFRLGGAFLYNEKLLNDHQYHFN